MTEKAWLKKLESFHGLKCLIKVSEPRQLPQGPPWGGGFSLLCSYYGPGGAPVPRAPWLAAVITQHGAVPSVTTPPTLKHMVQARGPWKSKHEGFRMPWLQLISNSHKVCTLTPPGFLWRFWEFRGFSHRSLIPPGPALLHHLGLSPGLRGAP